MSHPQLALYVADKQKKFYLFIVGAKLNGVRDEAGGLLLGHGADVLQSNHQLESNEQKFSLRRSITSNEILSSNHVSLCSLLSCLNSILSKKIILER